MKTERLPVRICDCGSKPQCKTGNMCNFCIFILYVFFCNNEEYNGQNKGLNVCPET
jgi:hypothetical protein